LTTPSGVAGEQAQAEHYCTHHDAGGDSTGGPSDYESDDDEQRADCIVGESMEPSGKKTNK